MKKIISFSLWGNLPVYATGALRNAELAAEIYPGWICRFYLGRDVSPELVQRLGAFPHVETVIVCEPPGWRGMFWRFYPAAERNVEAVLVRDVDCRLNRREAGAVLEWLGSSSGFHIMRDHPLHRTEILGGMWGVKGGILADLRRQIRRYKPRESFWQIDQNFLRDRIFPRVCGDALVHDEFFGGRPFPSARVGEEFVGQAFDEAERPLQPEHGAMLRASAVTGDFPPGGHAAALASEVQEPGGEDPLAITLLVPTCDRPDNMANFARSVEATAAAPGRVGIAFGIHPDDGDSLRMAESLAQRARIRVQAVLLKRDPEVSLTRLWNRLYAATREPIVGFFGDDVVFRSPGWDFSVREEFRCDPGILVFGDDRLQSGRLATLFFTHRRVHDHFGFYMPENFRRAYMDTWWDRIYRRGKRIHYRRDLIFEHLHPSLHPARVDTSFQHLEALVPQDLAEWKSERNQRDLRLAIRRFRMLTWKWGWEKIRANVTRAWRLS